MKPIRLGVNIDHVATLRNARGGVHPCPLRAAEAVARCGAEILTIHLREDRRHIRDADVRNLIQFSSLPVNLEMAATPAMLEIALREKPAWVCFVPEKREELTTEGGLNAHALRETLGPMIAVLSDANIHVSLFIDGDTLQVEAAKNLGARAVELHTGAYTNQFGSHEMELLRLQEAARYAANCGLQVHAGHGLNFENVGLIAQIPEIEELNIGHFLVGEALFTGLEPAIANMQRTIAQARSGV